MARDFQARPYTALPSDERVSIPVRTGDGRSAIIDAWRRYRKADRQEPARSSWNRTSLISGAAIAAYFLIAIFLTGRN